MASSRDQGKAYFQRGKFSAAADSYTVLLHLPQPTHTIERGGKVGCIVQRPELRRQGVQACIFRTRALLRN